MTEAEKICQLEQQLADCDDQSPADRIHKVDLLNDLAWALSDMDVQHAQDVSERAYALANSPGDGAPTYKVGIAYSLRTQGYLKMRLGDYSLGLAQLLDALAIFETLPVSDGLADVYDGITSIHVQIGNLAEALAAAYKQLDAAERTDDKLRISNAYNNLAVLYFETGDPEGSRETLLLNLELAREIGHPRIECLTNINLGDYCLFAGDYESALEYALRSLQMSRELKYELFEVYALHMVGRCYTQMGEIPRALTYLHEGVSQSRTLHSKVTETLMLLTVGEAHRKAGQIGQARECLDLALTIAQSINGNKEVYQCHLLLSQICEEAGDFAQALAHYKKHQVFKELVAGEQANQRLKVLQVAHDTETAQKEAELAHLRTVELQQEITEHMGARSQLQRQLEFMRALSMLKQTLLEVAEGEADQRRLLTEALHHLLKPTQGRTITMHQNFDDPELGLCGQLIAVAADSNSDSSDAKETVSTLVEEFRATLRRQLPAFAARPDDFIASVFPWAIVPTDMIRSLETRNWAGGAIAELYAAVPEFRDYLLHKHMLRSLLVFPIHVNGRWWGTISLTEWSSVSTQVRNDPAPATAGSTVEWTEDEILMLGTATEMLASTLQRWQAEANLRTLNEYLEDEVEERTAQLRDTVDLLRAEVNERQLAEKALEKIMLSLENQLVARTEELAAFFDVTLLAGEGFDLPHIFEQVLPRILEATRSRAICIHLLSADRTALHLAAQDSLPQDAQMSLQTVELSRDFQVWLQQPNQQLVSTALSTMTFLPAALRVRGFETLLGVQIRIGHRIAGMLSCFRFTDRGFSIDEIALVTALAQQMGMLLETDRLRQNTRAMAVLEERQRLARDLHDSVTQSLYSQSLFSRAGREAAEDGDTERLLHSLTELERNTLHTLREMRLLLYELRPADLEDEGLLRAIELRLNGVERRVGLQLDVQLDELPEISPEREVELYHIIVEALNNIVKHAAANLLTLRLAHANGHIHLQIIDDGQGFDPSQTNGGMGLRNMRERISRLTGQLNIASEPGGGTRLDAVIPVRAEVG